MKIFILVAGLLLASQAFSEENNKEALMKNFCVSCHSLAQKSKRAPPIFAVKNHLIKEYPEREVFIAKVIEWVQNPQKDKVIMAGAVKKFGLMPKLPYPKEQLQAIAEYMYDTDLKHPAWYRKHYKQEHGKELSKDYQKGKHKKTEQK